ncbi:hypothetical protein [Alkalilimnicola sp. S0819]|uniref:hypothetical protein n=1 Tax=Alkalilimnicola sp. S0819 TaxID=2613922 RepID=UPI001261F276|nr:hypothetical protein [Alkalilimnicola sp. S0819]KAB7623407.1 hypothetical protein F3N43_09930 [Alkalilimnicola sp. S0819]MPQ16953.1 hypothetical protein [Alkalilimnicola sp. S0819]
MCESQPSFVPSVRSLMKLEDLSDTSSREAALLLKHIVLATSCAIVDEDEAHATELLRHPYPIPDLGEAREESFDTANAFLAAAVANHVLPRWLDKPADPEDFAEALYAAATSPEAMRALAHLGLLTIEPHRATDETTVDLTARAANSPDWGI